MGQEITITSDNFEQAVEQSDVPVLLDFWADWCMPCKMIAPALEELAGQYEGKIKIGKVNVDEQTDLASKFQVISIPTLLLLKSGEVVKQHVGAAPKDALEKLITEQL